MAIVFSGIFPPAPEGFTEKEDAVYYGVEFEDDTIRSDSEAGYELTRPRFTRSPRKSFSTGFTEMSQSDYDIFEDFWERHRGSKSFNWVNPTDKKLYTVRFMEAPQINYTGVGARPLYNVEVKLKQV